jgi:small basic protein
MILPILGLLLGIALGIVFPYNVPVAYSAYLSVAILAALDSVFGGIRASLEDSFDSNIFITGFFGNAILAALLAYLGDRLGVPIYLAAVVAFGTRLFQNFALIRRHLFIKQKEK